MILRLVAPLLLAAVLAPLPARGAALASHVAGEVLVRFRDGTPLARRAAGVQAHAHALLGEPGAGLLRVGLRPGETVEEALVAYAEDSAVEWAQPNYRYRATAVPSESTSGLYGQEWWLHNTGQRVPDTAVQGGHGLYPSSNPGLPGRDIGAEAAWDLVTDCSSVVVAILDTGVKYDHQDLAANMWDGGASSPRHGADCATTSSCATGDGDPMDENGHGTHVAGIVAAAGNDGVGAVGVCWRARLMAVRVLDAVGDGTTLSVASGLDFAVTHGASIINMSLAGAGADRALAEAVDRAAAAGVLLVVAAGNEASDDDVTPTYPCSFPSTNVLCVAALDQVYGLATFSNWGATSVDLAAPGTNILATWPGTHTAVEEPFTSGWTLGSGWGYLTLYDGYGNSVGALGDPAGWHGSASSRYAPVADDRASKSFDTSGADVVTMDVAASLEVSPGDLIRFLCSTAGDPFGPAAVTLAEETDVQSGGFFLASFDLGACRGPASTLGVRLTSALPSSAGDRGVALALMTIRKLAWNTMSYNAISGTSMATPVVTGVAAMLRSYQPGFTPEDVIAALTGGGRPVPDLAGRTRSGNAVDALGALTYVRPPRGLTFTVH